MYTRGEVAFLVYQRLSKSAATPGFFTAEKVNSAIQEALDLISAEMFLADQGFLKQLDYVDVEANQQTIDIKPQWEMIESVRYLIGNVYIPLAYDSEFDRSQWSPTSGVTQLPAAYRVIGNKLYFNPSLSVGGTNYLMIEYQRAPDFLRNDAQQLPTYFTRNLVWYVVYRSMSILAASMKQLERPWAQEEALWREKMLDITNKRNKVSTGIKMFQGF